MTNDYFGKYREGEKKKNQTRPIVENGGIHPRDYAIYSAEQCLLLSRKLENNWSEETRLTQRLLIYIASLLEELVEPQRNSREFFERLSKKTKDGKSGPVNK